MEKENITADSRKGKMTMDFDSYTEGMKDGVDLVRDEILTFKPLSKQETYYGFMKSSVAQTFKAIEEEKYCIKCLYSVCNGNPHAYVVDEEIIKKYAGDF